MRASVARSQSPLVRQDGLTLMELMVALALGGFLVLGVVNVFLTTRESVSVEGALARVQESGRFAMDILADDIRRAHYTGCNSVNRYPDVLIRDFPYEGLQGFRRNGVSWSQPAPDANDPGLARIVADPTQVRDGSDVLNMHIGVHVGTNLLTADFQPGNTTVSLNSNPGCLLENGEPVILSSCLTATLFEADVSPASCTDPNSPVTLTLNANNVPDDDGAGYNYTSRSEVMRFESVTWFVGDTGRNRNGVDVFALYRQTNGAEPEEMIEGVEFMQILYGQRLGTANAPRTRFIPAGDSELEWDDVISVRIGLLIQSYEPVRDINDERSYVLADPNSPLDPNQHGGGLVLRQAFRTTAAVRNTKYDL